MPVLRQLWQGWTTLVRHRQTQQSPLLSLLLQLPVTR